MKCSFCSNNPAPGDVPGIGLKTREAVEAIIEKASSQRKQSKRFIIAIDGRCAAGKTTLAAELQKRMKCTVFHMDDFFLRPEQRSKKRIDTPGGNIDRERFAEEVLIPFRSGAEAIDYSRFDCKTMSLLPKMTVKPEDVIIAEGSYSCHPELSQYYDLRVFLTIPCEEQSLRIMKRNGEDALKVFKEKWIPLEEKYFKSFDIEKNCDLAFMLCD